MRVVIDQTSSGKWRVRAAETGEPLRTLESYDTREHAEAIRDVLREEAKRTSGTKARGSVGSIVREFVSKRTNASARNDVSRARLHILSDPIAEFKADRLKRSDVKNWLVRLASKRALVRGADRKLVESPRTLSEVTRRECYSILAMALDVALDAGIIKTNPARGIKFAKRTRSRDNRKALAYLYPDEEARLVSCVSVPLAYRVLYGFLSREGMRKSEALGLTWDDVDIARGIVRLDDNKTDDPRAWALGADVVRALSWWRNQTGSSRVFVGALGEPLNTARSHRLRSHLRKAGVVRAELYERSDARQPIRLHDTRATFVTLALAAGRSEQWVMDRTGHTTSAMLTRYRRAARTAREVGLGWLRPLDSLLGTPVSDPRSIIHATERQELQAITGRYAERDTRLEQESQGLKVASKQQDFEGRGSLLDLASSWISAIEAGDHALATALGLDVAVAAGPLIDRSANLRASILAGGDHAHRATADLLSLLLPDAQASRASRVRP